MKLIESITRWHQEMLLMEAIQKLRAYIAYSGKGSQFAVPGEVDTIYKNLLEMYHEQYGGK